MKFYLIFKFSDFTDPRDFIDIRQYESLPICVDWCREYLLEYSLRSIFIYSADDRNKFLCRVFKNVEVEYSF